MTTISAETLRKLICDYCGRYLSLQPITRSEYRYICGRCNENHKNPESDVLEDVLQDRRFPCIYDTYGCKEALLFGNDVKHHENSCFYKPMACPLKKISKCGKWMAGGQIYSHFLSVHEDAVIHDLSFPVKLENAEHFKLYHSGFTCYIIKYKYEEEKGMTFLIFQMEEGASADTEGYNVLLSSQSDQVRHISVSGNLLPYKVEEAKTDVCQVDKNVLKYIAQSQDIISVRLSLQHAKTRERFPKCMGCAVMLPKVHFQCASNHFMCEKCSEKGEQCAICFENLAIVRNIAFPLQANVIYPCLHEKYGCPFYGRPAQLDEHFKSCKQQEIHNCPFQMNLCYWKGFENCMFAHCKENHHIFDSTLTISKKDVVTNNIYVIATPGNKLHFLSVKYDKHSEIMYFNMEELKSTSKNKFVIRWKGHEIQHSCSPRADVKDDFFKHCLGISTDYINELTVIALGSF